MLPSVDENLLDRTTEFLHTEGYEWNEYLCHMTQYEIDLDPNDYSRCVKECRELLDYIEYLRQWF